MTKLMKIFTSFMLAMTIFASGVRYAPVYADEGEDGGEEITDTSERDEVEDDDDLPDTYDIDSGLETTDDGETVPEQTDVTPPPEMVIDIPDANNISHRYSKEYKLLTDLAVIEEDYDSDTVVTRGEFAALLTRMMGVTEGETRLFKDVFTKTANSKAISIITGYGLMSADDYGYFRPKEPVTIDDAAKALLKLAGYGSVISVHGGEKEGYTKLAAENGLVSDKADGSLTWGRMVSVVYKALDMDVIDIENVSDIYGFRYFKSSTKLLSVLYGLEEVKGYVSANEYASLKGRAVTGKNKVTVTAEDGDWTYSVGDTDIKDKLGYHIKLFFYRDEGNYTIVAYRQIQDTAELDIKEKDFGSIDRALSEIEYYDGSKKKRARLESDASIIYNGAMCYSVSTADFTNADNIHLLDINEDHIYDICSISAYDAYMVDSYSAEYGIIADKREGISYTIDDNYDVTVKKYGLTVDRDAISEWDIVRVYQTKPGSSVNLIQLVVSSDIITGHASLASTTDRTVDIDGTQYDVKKSVDMSAMFGYIAAGVDEDMRVLCYISDKVNTDRQYGYLIRMSKTQGSGGNDDISITLMNDSGIVVTLPVAETFSVNGKGAKWKDLYGLVGIANPAYDTGMEYDNGRTKEQLFSYMLNESGEIRRMCFAVDGNGNQIQSGAVDAEKETELVLNKKFTSPRVWDEYGTVNGEYIYGNDTKLFKIVTDENGYMIEELSGMFTKGQLRFSAISRVDSGSRPNEVYCYDAGVERECSAMLVKLPYASITSMAPYARQIFIVDKVKNTIDSEGDVKLQVHGYYAGAEAEFFADERKNIDLSTWKHGDVFFISLSTESKIIAAVKSFSMTDTNVYCPLRDYTGSKPAIATGYQYNPAANVTTYAEGINTMYGTVSNVGSKAIRIMPEQETQDIILQYSGTCVYIYHTDSDNIEISSTKGISKGMGTGKAYVYARYGFARDILIIK